MYGRNIGGRLGFFVLFVIIIFEVNEKRKNYKYSFFNGRLDFGFVGGEVR